MLPAITEVSLTVKVSRRIMVASPNCLEKSTSHCLIKLHNVYYSFENIFLCRNASHASLCSLHLPKAQVLKNRFLTPVPFHAPLQELFTVSPVRDAISCMLAKPRGAWLIFWSCYFLIFKNLLYNNTSQTVIVLLFCNIMLLLCLWCIYVEKNACFGKEKKEISYRL